ncbi:MAG: adenine nucleotide alpha hydrolase family protein [Bacteroidaceae bacterium]|nr:adenine nucleotide alpha hydrolase family protein [Bacteroidaceae bacterium]
MSQSPKQTASYKLQKRVRDRFAKAIKDFSLIENNDHLLIGLSGGKDSLALLQLLGEYKRRSPLQFGLTAVHVRMQGIEYHSSAEYLERFSEDNGAKFVLQTAEWTADRQANRTPCFLCSWNRRKQLFETAKRLGCNKIALGHHQDDILHTALMNLSFSGSFSTMPVKMQMRKFAMQIIRPLCYEHEEDLLAWAEQMQYVPQTKTCPYEHSSTRSDMSRLFQQMQMGNPEFRYSLWRALEKEGKLVEE